MAKRKREEEEEEVDVKDALKEDQKFKQYKRIIKLIAETVDVEKLEAEIKMLHAGRSARRLAGKVPTADEMIKANLQEGAARSRMAEISVELMRQMSLVKEANNAIKRHILHEFHAQVVGLRTKSERISFAERFISRGVKLETLFNDMIDRCAFLIKDVDQMGYSLKNSMAALEIFYSHKNDKQNI